MAQELYELMSDRAADIVRIKNVKFLSVMTPDDDGVFVFRYTNIAEHDDNVEFNVSVSSGDTTYARLTLACRQT